MNDELMRKAFELAQSQQSNYKTLSNGQVQQKQGSGSHESSRPAHVAHPHKKPSR